MAERPVESTVREHFKVIYMKGFLLGAWIGAALFIAISNAISGVFSVGMAAWGVATFAGLAVLVFAGRDGRAL